jgi:hypothetical protein
MAIFWRRDYLAVSFNSNFVIPAKAGIHGRTAHFRRDRCGKGETQTMDSRFRGNNNITLFQYDEI